MATKKTTDTPAVSTSKPAKSPAKSAAKTPVKQSVASETVASTAVSAEKKPPTREEISQLAHRYWKERGYHHGSHEDDWLRAERELQARS